MKQLFFIFVTCVAINNACIAQTENVGIGTSNPEISAALDIKSTEKGLLIPRLTLQQRLSIINPASSLLVYQTTYPAGFYYNKGTIAAPSWAMLDVERRFAFATNYIGDGAVPVLNNVSVAVPFTEKKYDLGNNYATASSILNPNNFIASADGLYHFDAGITWFQFSTSTGNASIKLKVNGVEVHDLRMLPQTSGKFSQQMSIDLFLYSGDKVQLCAYQSSGVTQHLAAGGNWFSGHFVMN